MWYNSLAMEKKSPRVLSIVLLAAALALCIYGAVRGEAEAILLKAAKICMECIGLD